MRCARSAAWSSTAGFHHGIEQEHVVGRGEVEAGAARLEREQHHRRAASDPGTRRPRAPRSRVLPSSRHERDARLLRACGSTRSSSDVHCEKTSALWPSASASSSARSRRSSLDDAARRAGRAASARVAARLAQAQQRLERGQHAAARLQLRDDLLLGGGADRVVELALRVARAMQRSTTSVRGGSSVRDLALQPAQHERPDAARAAARRAGSPSAIGSPVALLEVGAAAEQAAGSGSGTGSTARRAGSRPACRSGVMRKRALSSNAARATWLSGFLMVCASSSTTVSHVLLAEQRRCRCAGWRSW